jgi:predicted dehydrogenase
MNIAEAQAAVAVCRQRGVRLFEGYVFKYHPQHAQISSLVASGRIGAPRFFQAEFCYPRPTENDIRLKTDLAGGVFHDSAGYPVAAALMHIASQPVAVSCVQSRDAASGVDDACAITIHFAGGEVAQLYAAFGVNYRSRYAIAGTRGRIESARAFSVLPDKTVTVTVETDAGLEKITVAPADQFRLMIEAFCANILGRAADETNFENDLLRLQSVMGAAIRSAREQRIISIENL